MLYAEVCGEVVLPLKTLDNFSTLESERADLKLNIKKLRSWHPAPLIHDK